MCKNNVINTRYINQQEVIKVSNIQIDL